ncbi:hypothetical protein IQ07DRAFT_635675 [Pyrenochaeta sp. DS3sAY3a]|nr:hypothetical protein IQ07DRAFT_635675 [Pyrenochaeta sp. DS3sAY3a]
MRLKERIPAICKVCSLRSLGAWLHLPNMQLPRANIQVCHPLTIGTHSTSSLCSVHILISRPATLSTRPRPEMLQQKRNNNDDFFFRVRDRGRDAGAVDTNIATCEATNHTHSHNANSTPETVFSNAMDTNTTATVLPHLSSDEILGHMALRGHLQSGSQDNLKTLVLQHYGTQKLHVIHGGTAMLYHDLLNLIALEKAPGDRPTAGEHDLFQFPPDTTPKEVWKKRTTGIYIHEHTALLLAKQYPVAYSVVKAAANECVQTFGLDSSLPLCTANGISQILMHYSANHKQTDGYVSCCEACGLVFNSRAGAIDHFHHCHDLQHLTTPISCSVTPGFAAFFCGFAKRDTLSEDDVRRSDLVFRYADQTSGAFIVTVRQEETVEIQGLVAVTAGILSIFHKSGGNHYSPRTSRAPRSSIEIFNCQKLSLLKGKLIPVPTAKEISQEYGHVEYLQPVWNVAHGDLSENISCRALTCVECSFPMNNVMLSIEKHIKCCALAKEKARAFQKNLRPLTMDGYIWYQHFALRA